jgi:hypothetical protein
MKMTTYLHLVPRSKNEWNYTSTPQYAFMAWCLVKAQGQLYLYLYCMICLFLIDHTLIILFSYFELCYLKYPKLRFHIYMLPVKGFSEFIINLYYHPEKPVFHFCVQRFPINRTALLQEQLTELCYLQFMNN